MKGLDRMFESCRNVLIAAALSVLACAVGGCGLGVVEAAEVSNALTIQSDLGQLQASSKISDGGLHAVGNVGDNVLATFTAFGGPNPYGWSVAWGSLPTGLALNSNGVMSGQLLAPGNWSAAIQVADHNTPSNVKTQMIFFEVDPRVLTVNTSSLNKAQSGAPYQALLLATGGTPMYTWSVKSGTLPAGLNLTKDGFISGVPSSPGTSSFTVMVTDTGNPAKQATQALALTVKPAPLLVTTTSLVGAQKGIAYSTSLNATGGTPAYRWTLSAGKLPAGLSLDSTGTITGTPTATGTSQFAVAVTDAGNPAQTFTQTLSLTVTVAPITVTSTRLAGAVQGSGYSTALLASGGTPAYLWAINYGTLPPGLVLLNSGTLSGVPTAAGTFNFAVMVHDAGAPIQFAIQNLSLTIAPPALSVTTSSLGAAVNGSSYSATLGASGGTPAYTWSTVAGALPTGLSLSSAGTITGTPKSAGTYAFTVQATDSGSPAQQSQQSLSLTVAASPIAVTTGSLASGQNTVSYVAQLSATGGTSAYTWSIKSGSLPSGLSLSATTGVIAGTPSAAGSSTFTYGVTDSGNPQQSATATATIVVANAPAPTAFTTWFVRPDGGNRYDASLYTPGQCDGKADAAYPGTGTNQHCAFSDVRYMFMIGTYGNSGWIMAGGDTLVIRGCKALPSQQNPDAPHCRIGWDTPTGTYDSGNFWCAGTPSCSILSPPSGTAEHHTRILGQCAYGTYSCNPVTGYPYTNNNLTQIFGGYNAGVTMYLNGSQYVDVEGLEITAHNGQCARYGTTNPLPQCSRSAPMSDQADQGIVTDNKTSNILLQDVYIHGFSSNGISGPIGGPMTLTRVSLDFNAFAGWNFDDGNSTPNGPGASITQSYVTMVGNGCQEEYPIAHTQFPAKGCWDSGNGGFGDSWSGQGADLVSFTCDHCNISYNTKDGAMGPHTGIANLSLTNSIWAGNMGQSQKWGQNANSTFLFQNNIILGNCYRLSQQMPGAAQNFDSKTGLPGSGLSNYCRAAGAVFAYFTGANSTVNINNNTIVTYQPTVFQMSCNGAGNCGTSPYHITNNLILGYTVPVFGTGQPPGLYYTDDSSIVLVGSHNLEYGVRNRDTCGTNGNVCSDPMLVGEPAQGTVPPEAMLDNFNYHPTPASPAIGVGTVIAGLLTDIFGNQEASLPTLGAVAQ